MSPSSFPFLNYFFLRMLANSPIFCGVVRGDRCRREFFSRHLKIGILYFSGYFIFPFISNSTSYLDSDRNSNRNQFPNFDMYYTTRSKNAARRNVTCSPSDTSPSPSTLERRWSYFERNKRFARFDYKLRRIYDERWKGIRDRRRTGRGCLKATAFR